MAFLAADSPSFPRGGKDQGDLEGFRTKKSKRSWDKEELNSQNLWSGSHPLPSPVHTGEENLTLALHSLFHKTEGALFPISTKLGNSDHLFSDACSATEPSSTSFT